MKKFTFRSLLAIAAAGVLFTACKDENDDGNTSKTTYEFSVKAEDNPISAPADGKNDQRSLFEFGRSPFGR